MRDPMGAFRPRERKCEAKSVRRWCICFSSTQISCHMLHKSAGCLYVQDGVGEGERMEGRGKGANACCFHTHCCPTCRTQTRGCITTDTLLLHLNVEH